MPRKPWKLLSTAHWLPRWGSLRPGAGPCDQLTPSHGQVVADACARAACDQPIGVEQAQRRARRIPLAYAALASAWIVASDAQLFHGMAEESTWHLTSVVKGLGFVLVTTFVLAWSLRLQARRHAQSLGLVLAAGEESRRSQRTLAALTDASPDLVVLFDAEGRCTAFNAVAEQVIGLNKAQVLGRTPGQLIIPQAFRPWWPQAGRQDVIGPAEESFILEDGSGTRRLDLKLGLLRDPDGQHIGHFLHGNDVTRAHEAFLALAAKEQKYRMLFDANPTPMWVYTIDDRQFQMVNAAALAQYGYTQAQFLGLTLDQIRPQQDRERMMAWLEHLKAQRPRNAGSNGLAQLNHSGVWRHLTSNGQELLVDITSGEIRFNGRPARLVLARDVTDLVQTEDELARSRDQVTELARHLLRHERVLRQQLALTLHDNIGQSLAVVRLQLDRLTESCRPHLNAPDLATAERIGQGLSEVFGQLRTLLTELRPVLLEEHGLAAALDEELGRRQDAFPDVEFRLEADDLAQRARWPAEVEFAAFMVVKEAIANALRHGGPGQVRVSVAASDPEGLVLRIRDDGAGMAPDRKQTSLGIVGMRERCLGIGAMFAIDSQPGTGTTVHMRWQPEPAD